MGDVEFVDRNRQDIPVDHCHLIDRPFRRMTLNQPVQLGAVFLYTKDQRAREFCAGWRQQFIGQPRIQYHAHRMVRRIKFVKGFKRGDAPSLSGFHSVPDEPLPGYFSTSAALGSGCGYSTSWI